MGKPWALMSMETYTREGEWVSARELTQRMHPRASEPDVIVETKNMSRHMSNAARDGHLVRRERPNDKGSPYWEYAVPCDLISEQLAREAAVADPTRLVGTFILRAWYTSSS